METKEEYKTVNKRALARDLMTWAAMKERLDELEAAIKDTVLQLGETFTVGDVRATFNSGRKTYNYEGAIASYSRTHSIGDLRDKYAKLTYDYKGMCDELGIVTFDWTQSDPSVTLKII